MADYLIRLNLKSDSVPYTLRIRDNCYGSYVTVNVTNAQLSFLYKTKSKSVSITATKAGNPPISKNICLCHGCNRASLNYTFGQQPLTPIGIVYNFTLTDRNYGLPLDGTLVFSN